MEDNKTLSSLPPNYVTLVQLQERWLKEKEEKQKEREEKQKQKRKLQPQNAVAQISRPGSKSLIRRGLERSQPDKPETSVSEVHVGGDNKNVDQEGKSVKSNNKKKKDNNKKNHPKTQNPGLVVEERKEVTESDRVAHKPQANEVGGDVRGRRNKESGGMESKFRAKSSSRDSNRTKVAVETKFRDLSINDSKGKGCNEMKRTSTYNDRRKRELRDCGFCKQVRNPRDAGLIWVKKGERFDGNVGRMQTLDGSHSVSGPQDDIRFDVNVKQPRTLGRTIGVAQLMEEQNQLQKRQSQQYRFHSTSAILNSGVGVLRPLPNQLLNPSLYTTPTTSQRITNQKGCDFATDTLHVVKDGYKSEARRGHYIYGQKFLGYNIKKEGLCSLSDWTFVMSAIFLSLFLSY